MIHIIGKGIFFLGMILFIVCGVAAFKYGADAELFLITIGVMTLGLGVSYFSKKDILEEKSIMSSPDKELNELFTSLQKKFDEGGGIPYLDKVLDKKFDWELSLWGNDWAFHKDDAYHYLLDVTKYTYNKSNNNKKEEKRT